MWRKYVKCNTFAEYCWIKSLNSCSDYFHYRLIFLLLLFLKVFLSLPGSQTQHGGDVVFCWIVEVNRHVAVQLLSSAPFALLRQTQLLSDHGHGHNEQVTAWSTNRRAAAAAAAAVTTAADGCLPSAALLLHTVAAGGELSRLELNIKKSKQGKMDGQKERCKARSWFNDLMSCLSLEKIQYPICGSVNMFYMVWGSLFEYLEKTSTITTGSHSQQLAGEHRGAFSS